MFNDFYYDENATNFAECPEEFNGYEPWEADEESAYQDAMASIASGKVVRLGWRDTD